MADHKLTTLSQQLGQALQQRGWLLALAESCTGGMAAQYITAIAGSSVWFDAGFVTYSNCAKNRMLGVQPSTIEHHGAVSEETAREMAAGALAHSQAHIAAAITGVAGPGGGSIEKPVGTVCFAWATRTGLLLAERHLFSGDRLMIREASVKTVFEQLLSLTLARDL